MCVCARVWSCLRFVLGCCVGTRWGECERRATNENEFSEHAKACKVALGTNA